MERKIVANHRQVLWGIVQVVESEKKRLETSQEELNPKVVPAITTAQALSTSKLSINELKKQ